MAEPTGAGASGTRPSGDEASPAVASAREAAVRGDLSAAQAHLERALDLGADPAEVHLLQGRLHAAAGRMQDAIDAFELAHHFRPEAPEAGLELSAAYLRLARFDDALEAARAATRCAGAGPAAFSNLGLAARAQGRYDEAEQALRRALALDAANLPARVNLGLVLKDLGRIDEAVAGFEAILADHPEDGEARWNLAVLRLARGEYRRGWEDYGQRWRQRDALARHFDFPAWDGTPPGDRIVLVYAEQGLGDEIMFASCIPDAMRRGGRWIVECSPRLQGLFRRSFPGADVRASPLDAGPGWRERLGRVDLQVAAGSLPGLLGREAGAFPAHTGYLRADPERAAAWKGRLARLGPGLKVGLSWRGGDPRTGRRVRSIELAQLAPVLAARGCRFVSLQYGDAAAECDEARRALGAPLAHWPEALADLDETAALVGALDLVVTVTTAVVHLSGALGAPAWVMVPASPEWRYGLSGERMPWYPSVRLLRQERALEWEPLIGRVARELAALATG